MSMRLVDEESIFTGSVSPAPDVLVQELPNEESIFLNLRTESYFGLDPVGTKMYRALMETSTVKEAFEQLTAQFEVEPARLRRDVSRFVQRLVDQGLLVFHART